MVSMPTPRLKKTGTKVSTKLLESGSSPIEMTIDYKVGILRKLLDRTSAESVKKFGLTLSDWRILTHIHAAGSVTASELCERLLIDKAEASRVAAALIEKKILVRKQNPKNLRSALLSLSKKGNDIFERVLPIRLAFDAELSSFLTKDEYALFLYTLNKLTSNIVRNLANEAGSNEINESGSGHLIISKL